MAVWVIRGGSAKGLHEEEFLTEQSIGIYFLADIDLTNATTDEIRADVARNYRAQLAETGIGMNEARVKGVVTYYTNQMLLFRDAVEVGDTVLMPRKRTGGHMVAVGKIASAYEHWPDQEYQHRRKVAWEQESVPADSLPYEWQANDQKTVFRVG